MRRHCLDILFRVGLAGGVVLTCGVGAALAATTWYVSPNGNDAHTCKGALAAKACRTINAAIGKASGGDTIRVAAGSYVENVVIDKPLTVIGAGSTTKIVPAISGPLCAGGSLCPGASNIILVEADNVTIRALALDGDNPAINSGEVRGGADLDARNGIITNHPLGVFDNLTVANVRIRNVYLRGIYASSGGSFTFDSNVVTNVQGDYASIGIFNFGGAGMISRNTVSFANDAISSNWSRGVQFLNNKVTNSGSGVHTDNAGAYGGPADVIQNNTISQCLTDGYGIFVFMPYIAPSVLSNTVKSCSVGIAAFGRAAPVTTVFSGNVVNGLYADNSDPTASIGLLVSTDILTYGSTDVAITFTNNAIQQFKTGVYVEQQCELFSGYPGYENDCDGPATQATANIHYNNITRNKTQAKGLPGTIVSAENNWWGCTKGPNNTGCGTVTGTVTFTPWLTSSAPVIP